MSERDGTGPVDPARRRPRPGRHRVELHTAEDVPFELIDADDLPVAPPSTASAVPATTDATVPEPTAPEPTVPEPTVPEPTVPEPTAHRRPAPLRRAVPPTPRVPLTTIVDAAPETADVTPVVDADAPPAGAAPAPAGRGRRWRSVAVRTGIVLAVAAVVALLLRAYVVEPFYIPSESMEPTLYGCSGCTDDRILVDKISYRFTDPKVGDVVVFHKPPNAQLPDDVLVKRIVARAGDRVELRRNSAGQWDGKVYVNGSSLTESYLNPKCQSPVTVPLTATSSWTVPAGDVFVLGDNRCYSDDSRAFGPITVSSIIGRAVLIIWPFRHIGII